jgi:hypothetical protein
LNKFVKEKKNYKNIPQRKDLLKSIYCMSKKSEAADLFTKHVIPALIDAVKKKDLKPLAALMKEKTEFKEKVEKSETNGVTTYTHKSGTPVSNNLKLEER